MAKRSNKICSCVYSLETLGLWVNKKCIIESTSPYALLNNDWRFTMSIIILDVVILLTEPEFAGQVPKSFLVGVPVAIKFNRTILPSLDNLTKEIKRVQCNVRAALRLKGGTYDN